MAALFATALFATALPATLVGAASISAPRGVHATEDAGVVVVRWARPTSTGGRSLTYVVTANPSNVTCATKSTSCVEKHLGVNTSYTFTVVARGLGGASARSAPSNRVRVASAKVNYLAAVTTLNAALAKDQTAINASTTPKRLTAALALLSSAYGAFDATLTYDEWPAAARADIAGLVGDVKVLAQGWVNAYEANTTNVATLFSTLQGEENKQIEQDALVRTDLGLAEVISAPSSTTPSPAPLATVQVVHDFQGNELSVAASQVVDPATAASGSGLADAGYRFVAVELTLSDASGGEIEGDVNFSTTVVGSDNQTYSADFGNVAECSNPVFGLFTLLGGDNSSGCVVFELPTGVTVQTVSFSLAPGYLDAAEWNG